MPAKKKTGTIAVDFDGVIHAYSKGWQNGELYDEPVPGAADGIRKLMETWAVYVFTSRTNLTDVAYYVRDHLAVPVIVAHSSTRTDFWNEMGVIYVTNVKLPAIAYIDDRGIRFTSWDQTLHDLEKLTS